MTTDAARVRVAAKTISDRIIDGYFSCYCPHGSCCAIHDDHCDHVKLRDEAKALRQAIAEWKE